MIVSALILAVAITKLVELVGEPMVCVVGGNFARDVSRVSWSN